MTLDQALAFAIIVGIIVLLVWDRIRYDVVALGGLLVAVAVGIVPAKEAFTGFSDEIVVIVASALVISMAISRSGIVERVIRPLTPFMSRTEAQIAILVTLVAFLSAFMKNIGALAIFMPIAFQLARRTGRPVSRLLMPLSFGSLLGGLMTLIGTSPNIIVSRVREEMLGEPFGMFSYMPVGIVLTALGILFLTFGWRLLPGTHRSSSAPENLFSVADYRSEVGLPETSPLVGKTVAELEKLGEGEVKVAAVIRERYRRYVPAPDWTLLPDDVLVLQSDPHALARIIAQGQLELLHGKELEPASGEAAELTVVEAVVKAESPMVGLTVGELHLRERHNLNLLAVSRAGERSERRMQRLRFRAGDLLVLQGLAGEIYDQLGELGCLPLAERRLQLGRQRRAYLPALILAVAMVLVTTGVTTVPVAFFGAATVIMLTGTLSVREAYEAVEGPVLVLLGALIPVSDALRTTGGTDLVAGWLSVAGDALPPTGAVALMLVAAMAVTPFLNNAATVLVMAPIGASLATRLQLSPDPFLMAVAVGAACDFLTPIGHQCNTLVMAPGGYRFSDYWKLGLPLSIIVIIAGTLLISIFWPIR
jgi:di/tricarboxylate transporter